MKIFILFPILFTLTTSYGQETKQIVKITNIENVKGDIYIGWYEQTSTFKIFNRAIHFQKISVLNQKQLNAVFKNIPFGEYAIAVFLDQNNNGKLDNNLFGIPKEKYGFSNNILPAIRSATFDEAKFHLENDKTTIEISLKSK
jgi:uncharacterized protein (DUF2141 family)